MKNWVPGSYDQPWSWWDEFKDIGREKKTWIITLSVLFRGVRVPVELGNDGRVWEGHHRIIAARMTFRKVPAFIW